MASIPLSLTSCICSRNILAKLKVCICIFSNTGYSHKICSISFSAPHLLYDGVFALLVLCSIYYRLTCPFRSSTCILQCFLSSLLMNWTYLLVSPSRHNWLQTYLPKTLHSVCFLFCIQFLILNFNLLKDNGSKGSGLIGLVLALCLANLSAVLFCWMPLCRGAHIIITWFSSVLYSPL